MDALNKIAKYILVILLLFIPSVAYFWYSVGGYNTFTKLTIVSMGTFESFLFVSQIIFLLLMLSYTYVLCKYYLSFSKIYYNLNTLGHFILYILTVLITFVIVPFSLYLNGMMTFVGVFMLESESFALLTPNLVFSDFWILCTKNPGTPPPAVPPMGGHIVVAGIHEGKNYVCADIVEALTRTFKDSPVSLKGVQGFQKIVGIPDVVCSGLEKSTIPSTNQTKN